MLILIVSSGLALCNPNDPVCLDQKLGVKVVFSVGGSKEQIEDTLRQRGEDPSKCIWAKRKDLPVERIDRDQWAWDATLKKVKVDRTIPKSKSQRLRDQFTVISSTASSKNEKLDALLEIEKIRSDP